MHQSLLPVASSSCMHQSTLQHRMYPKACPSRRMALIPRRTNIYRSVSQQLESEAHEDSIYELAESDIHSWLWCLFLVQTVNHLTPDAMPLTTSESSPHSWNQNRTSRVMNGPSSIERCCGDVCQAIQLLFHPWMEQGEVLLPSSILPALLHLCVDKGLTNSSRSISTPSPVTHGMAIVDTITSTA